MISVNEFVKMELLQIRKKALLEIGKEKQKEAGKLYGEKHSQEVLSTIDKGSHKRFYQQLIKALTTHKK